MATEIQGRWFATLQTFADQDPKVSSSPKLLFPLGQITGLIPDKVKSTEDRLALLSKRSRQSLELAQKAEKKNFSDSDLSEFISAAPEDFNRLGENKMMYCLLYASTVINEEYLCELQEFAYSAKKPDCGAMVQKHIDAERAKFAAFQHKSVSETLFQRDLPRLQKITELTFERKYKAENDALLNRDGR